MSSPSATQIKHQPEAQPFQEYKLLSFKKSLVKSSSHILCIQLD